MYDWQNVWITIMAGGRGSRFWPWSQPKEPKQFLRIPPVSEKLSLLQATLGRFTKKVPNERILIVGLAEHEKILRQQLKTFPPENLILEPFGRNTAASVAMGALISQKRAAKRHQSAKRQEAKPILQLVLAADHHITNANVLLQTIETGMRYLAHENSLLTFGIEPRWAETGYGYIEAADELFRHEKMVVYRAASFREKPDRSTAQEYLDAQRFFWNSGMFLWKGETILQEFAALLPATLSACESICHRLEGKRTGKIVMRRPRIISKREYNALQSISIDYAVMEKSKQVAVVRTPLQWSDMGGWESLYQLLKKDPHGNVLRCRDVKLQDVRNSLFYCNDLQVIAYGVDDIVVAFHEGRLLITKRQNAADIRHLVDSLKKPKA